MAQVAIDNKADNGVVGGPDPGSPWGELVRANRREGNVSDGVRVGRPENSVGAEAGPVEWLAWVLQREAQLQGLGEGGPLLAARPGGADL